MRKILAVAALAALATASTGALAEPNPYDFQNLPKQPGQIQMVVAHTVNMEWSSHTAVLKRFTELVSIYTNNQIRGQIFPGAQLGGELEMSQQVRQGKIHVALPATNNLSAMAPSLNVFVLPYIATSTEEVNYLQDKLTPTLVPRVIKEANVRIVGWENSGWRAFFYKSDNPIEKPSDLSKLKMRVPPNPIMIASYKAWGGQPTPLGWTELYNALQQGVAQATDTSSGSFVSFRLYEQVKCLTAPGDNALWFMYEPVLISKKSWDKLNDAQKKALTAASKKAEAYFAKESKGLDDEMVATFKKNGVEVIELTDAEAAAWREVAQKTSYKNFAEKVPGGKELIEKALAVK